MYGGVACWTPQPSHGDHPHLTIITNHVHLYIFPSHSTFRHQIVNYTYLVKLSSDLSSLFLVILVVLVHHSTLLSCRNTSSSEPSRVTICSGNPPDPPSPDRHRHSPLLCVAINWLICTIHVLSSFVPCVWVHPVLARNNLLWIVNSLYIISEGLNDAYTDLNLCDCAQRNYI